MNYEQRYKEALKAVKELREANPSDDGIKNWVEEKFPELREREDERIRKCLITIIKIQKEGSFGLECNHGASWDEMLAWLEKQEQRPQSHWKPSDAQMQALKEACDKHWDPDGLDPLYTLYEHLKKL